MARYLAKNIVASGCADQYAAHWSAAANRLWTERQQELNKD